VESDGAGDLGLQVFFGIKFVSKLGLIFFAVVLYTMLSFYLGLGLAPRSATHPPSLTGLSWKTFKGNWSPGYPPGKSFSTAVALFFPCFTGILRYVTTRLSLSPEGYVCPGKRHESEQCWVIVGAVAQTGRRICGGRRSLFRRGRWGRSW
jgi:hypothetical protein